MLIHKIKTIKKHLVILLAVGFIAAAGILGAQHAFAAAAQCDTGAGPGGCPSPPGFNVDGGSFQPDHCYQLVKFGNTEAWQDVGCTGVFTPTKVECDDGTTVSYSGTTTPEQACAKNGGYTTPDPHLLINTGDPAVAGDTCGSGDPTVTTSLNYGCKHTGNGIMDFLYAMIRFLSAGVGLAAIASIIVGGIQYTTSRGDPNATAKAIDRIRNTVIAILFFIFIFAILNWLIPGGLL